MAVILNVLGRQLEVSLPVVVSAVLVVGALVLARLFKQDPRLPPSVPSHWLTGTTIPQPYSWRHFEKCVRTRSLRCPAITFPHRWSKEYGPVFTVRIGRTPLVVVNGYDAAYELLEKQANVTADRPRQVVADEVFSRNKRILLVVRWSVSYCAPVRLRPSAAAR
jgi:hypothetical protein